MGTLSQKVIKSGGSFDFNGHLNHEYVNKHPESVHEIKSTSYVQGQGKEVYDRG